MSPARLPHRIPRRFSAAAAAVVAVSLAVPGAAVAAPGHDAGLFGSGDPTYDGAYRQSIAIIGLRAAKAPVPAAAVTWLTAQQCADGSFQAYRPDLSAPCYAPDPAAFSGPDSNSTALAAMALAAGGRRASAARAITALTVHQNADGGWGYTLGAGSDVNSTGLALAAVRSAPASTATHKAVNQSIGRATSYLARAQFPCTASRATRFALPYQPGLAADPLASGQALIGIAGTLPYGHLAPAGVARTGCGAALAQQISAYLDRLLRSTRGRIPSALDSTQVDWNATATAVVGLGAAGAAPAGLKAGIAALAANTAAYVSPKGPVSPSAAGTLIQAAVGAGVDPRSFGSTKTNLVRLLLGTLTR